MQKHRKEAQNTLSTVANVHPTGDILSNAVASESLLIPAEEMQVGIPSQATFTIDANMLSELIQLNPNILQQLNHQGTVFPLESGSAQFSCNSDPATSSEMIAYAFDSAVLSNMITICERCHVGFENQDAFNAHQSNCAANAIS